MTSVPTLGEVIEVAEAETVVRLDGTPGRLAELVLTGDVSASLHALLAAAGGPGGGAGFWVVGPFGSGKSHFLAAFGELVSDPARVPDGPGWTPELRALARAARPSLTIAVPLVEYRSEARLEDVVLERARKALAPHVPSGAAANDRTAVWGALLAATEEAGAAGLVILLDELSEWLRAKQGPALTEDLRFLQFLGEWAGQHPVVVVAALQESIEEVANVSARELSRIRDRFRPSLTLSMRHVEDLVRGRLVRFRPGADRWARVAHEQLVTSFPESSVSFEAFLRCYPLHPETLSLLQGLRFLLSQQRGVVDFVCRRLQTALDRPCTELVTPDAVYDHFAGRLQERPETARLAGTVVGYFERSVGELVDEDDRELALRAVKLLVLLAASPLERPRSAAELAGMLQARVSDLDPSANVSYLQEAVLRPLAERGAYVVAEGGPPPTYRIDAGADAALVFAARVAQAHAELNPADRRLVATLAELGSSPVLPFQTLQELGWSRRELLWHNTLRSVVVGTTRLVELGPDDAGTAVARARDAGAEGCLLVAEPELTPSDAADALAAARAAVGRADRLAVWVPATPAHDEHDRLLDLHARRQVLDQVGRDGQSELVEVGSRTAEPEAAVARELLRRLYFEGQVVYAPPSGQLLEAAGVDLPSLAGLPFERQLPRLVDPLLSRLHPLHGQVAPRSELVGERLVRTLVYEAIPLGRLTPSTLQHLRSPVEAFLVPLGLARVRRDGGVIAPDTGRSPAVHELLTLVGEADGTPAAEVVARLGEGPVGLTTPEAVLLLNACVRAGLIEMTRGRKPTTEPFLTVAASDRLFAGELVESAVREVLGRVSAISGPGPFEPWTAATQRTVWHYAQAWLEARREDLAQVADGLAALEGIPVLSGADTTGLQDDAARVGEVVSTVAAAGSASPVAGLRSLAAALDDPEATVEAGRRLSRVARHLRDDLRRLEEAAAYLTHPDLRLPEGALELQAAHDTALRLLAESLALAADERAEEVAATVRDFRSAYLAAYQDHHDRYYAGASAQATEVVRASPAYRALAALSGIGAIAVPDDRVKVDRLLAAAVPTRCTRRVDLELTWRPTCACGLHLGDPLPQVDVEGLVDLARRGVSEYLVELGSPEVAERLAAAGGDLESLGQTERAGDLRRLLAFVRAAGDGQTAGVDPAEVVGLLDDQLQRSIRDILTGSQLIVARDLAALRDDLVGRRYTKRRLLALLESWVDPDGSVPPGGFVAVVDSGEGGDPDGAGGAGSVLAADSVLAAGSLLAAGTAGSPGGLCPAGPDGEPTSSTVALLRARWPSVARRLPAAHASDAFWLATWWAGRPHPPHWLPADLLSDPGALADAAAAAVGDQQCVAELDDLDRRAGPGTALGQQVEDALDLADAPAAQVWATLTGERLFRQPVRMAAGELLRRLAGDWQLLERLGRPDTGAVASAHALLDPEELSALDLALQAAVHLAAAERLLPGASPALLVEEIYAAHAMAVPRLLSRAELAASASSLVEPTAVSRVRAAACRFLAEVDRAWREHADAGFPGCLAVWDIGRVVVAPLLASHRRVAVLLVDALRADLSGDLSHDLVAALPGRPVERRWAVVPEPTRTAEAVAALAMGRPVPAGATGGSSAVVAEGGPAPFAHLGYETAVLLRADRDHQAAALRELWAEGPPLSVAVATGVDERLHRTSVELAALLDEAAAALRRRVLPSLEALPDDVPLVVLADHGFRENPAWGKGPEGRYVHGGTSLEECVIPVVVMGAR